MVYITLFVFLSYYISIFTFFGILAQNTVFGPDRIPVLCE